MINTSLLLQRCVRRRYWTPGRGGMIGKGALQNGGDVRRWLALLGLLLLALTCSPKPATPFHNSPAAAGVGPAWGPVWSPSWDVARPPARAGDVADPLARPHREPAKVEVILAGAWGDPARSNPPNKKPALDTASEVWPSLLAPAGAGSPGGDLVPHSAEDAMGSVRAPTGPPPSIA